MIYPEFDNPSFGYSSDPQVYRQAFRKIVDVCERIENTDACHSKVAFCWHSWAAPKAAELHYFYPGNDVVDWIGISIFQQLYPWANNQNHNDDDKHGDHRFAGGNLQDIQEVLDFATLHNKPIMIAESTPFGGTHLDDFKDVEWHGDDDIWGLWFQPTLDLISQYDISMWSYINCDWNSQPMWKDVGFGDTRIASSSKVMTHWYQKVLQEDSRFTNQLECGGGGGGSRAGTSSLPTMSLWIVSDHLYIIAGAAFVVLVALFFIRKAKYPREMDPTWAVTETLQIEEGTTTKYGSIEIDEMSITKQHG